MNHLIGLIGTIEKCEQYFLIYPFKDWFYLLVSLYIFKFDFSCHKVLSFDNLD